MNKCKECGEKNKYGYHLLDCKVLTDSLKQTILELKEINNNIQTVAKNIK